MTSQSEGGVRGDSTPRIEIRTGRAAGSTFRLEKRLVVGSDSACDIVLDDPEVSDEHASIRLSEGNIEVRDLASQSGTFINTVRIAEPTVIGPGDEVRVGSTIFAAAESTLPSAGKQPAAAASGAGAGAGGTAAPSSRRRPLIIAGIAGLVVIGIIAAVVALGGSSGSLSESEIVEAGEPATMMVIGRSSGTSPITGGTNKISNSGSAWVYDAEEGLIVTNAHVVQNASTVQAGFDSTSLRRATIVGVSVRDDLAVLRVGTPDLDEMPMTEDGSTEQGESVWALGFPSNGNTDSNFLKTPFQATKGTISTLDGEASVSYDAFGIDDNENAALLLKDLYQTDAAINPGNSGGPLVNDEGELVGVSVSGGGGESQNDAISVEKVRSVVPKLASGESVAWLGLGLSALDPSIAGCVVDVDDFCVASDSETDDEVFSNEDVRGGMLVTAVTRDTPVDQETSMAESLSFFSRNDFYMLVTTINGVPVTTQQGYVNHISSIESGQEVELCYLGVTFDAEVANIGPYCEKFPAP